MQNASASNVVSSSIVVKVPELTLIFWIIKILATTLGETGGDVVSMSMNLGYLIGTLIFAALFIVILFFQLRLKKFNPLIYWGTIIATTMVGTTLADFADRSLGIGYAGGSILLLCLLGSSLFIWYKTLGEINPTQLNSRPAEIFYWVTILFSQTLGTALGDWVADTESLGYFYSAIIFGSLLAIITIIYFTKKINSSVLFWSAFILSRPLGAVVGDYLDKPIAEGGLEWDRLQASSVLFVAILILIFVFKQKPAINQH